MDSMYEIDIFDPIKNRLELYQKSFVLSPELWRKFKIDDISSVDFTKWGCIKLINGGAFSPELSKLPDKHGGIYIYCIEPRIVPDVGIYVNGVIDPVGSNRGDLLDVHDADGKVGSGRNAVITGGHGLDEVLAFMVGIDAELDACEE